MILKVKLDTDKGALLPIRKHSTDAGADILTPRSFLLPAESSAIIRTGVHVELPPNTVGMLKSKSGLNIFHDIVGEGVIDEGFDGEIVVKLYNLGKTPYEFPRGSEIIQLVVMCVHYPEIVQADKIQGGERGSNGYGSTYLH